MDTKQLKQRILDLAIRGKLVPQDPNDEPASVLLERILAEKEQLIAQGKLKKSKTKASDKPHYGNVPFEIPESWEWTQIKEISSSILYGVSESAKSRGRYKLLRITDIQDNKVNWDTVPYTDFDDKKATAYILQNNDILFARTGATVGKSYLVQNLSALSIYASYLIRIQVSKKILSQYIKYYFESGYYWEQISDSSLGIGQPNVNGTLLGGLNLPLPPLAEQQRIVAEVEKWFAVIDKLETNKEDLKEYIKQVKSKVLELAIHGKLVPQDPNDEPAIELLKRINPNFKPCDTSHYENLPSGWCICLLEDIIDYEQPTQYIVESTDYDDEYKTPVLTAGKSFILGYTNERNGIYNNLPTIIFDDFTTDSRLVNFPFKVKSSAIKILQVNKDISIQYVAYFMSITRLAGNTHKRYWISEYSKIPIPIPPKKEQDRIVQIISEIENNLDSISAEL